MKTCPTCKRTFEDNLTYCLVDGSVLSAPVEGETPERDSRVTEVLPESARTPPPAQQIIPPQATIAAPFAPPPRAATPKLTQAESKPVALIGIIGLVTILYSVAIAILLVINWKDVNSYFGSVMVRRIPVFLLVFIGILIAIIRMRHHVRASLMTILALIVYLMHGFFFFLFSSSVITVMSKTKVSPSVSEWIYFFMYFFEDFIFAGVIILLVAAAYKGRQQISSFTSETI